MNKINQTCQLSRNQEINNSRIANIKRYRGTESGIQQTFQKLIKLGVKSNLASQYLKDQFFHQDDEKIEVDLSESNRFRIGWKKEMIKKIELSNQQYFVPGLEVDPRDTLLKLGKAHKQLNTIAYSRRVSVDNSHISVHMSSVRNQDLGQTRNYFKPNSLQNIQKRNNIRQTRKSFKKKLHTLPTQNEGNNMVRNSSKGLIELSNTSNNNIKKSNTFLFNIPTQVVPRRTVKLQPVFSWQIPLLDVLNQIMNSNIISKLNMKVDKDRLSNYLKQHFYNEVITTYYKLENSINFKTIKFIMDDMLSLSRKQANIISFFTYDVNNDGFICQEDIYYFLEGLPFHAKIMQDLNNIIEFLRKNKVRSLEVNLPPRLMEKKQKAVLTSIWKDIAGGLQINKFQEARGEREPFDKKFFTLKQTQYQQKEVNKEKAGFKKFQINFDVFNLIFSERRPVLISEIIKLMTEKSPPKVSQQKKKAQQYYKVKTEQTEQFIYTRSQPWKQKMSTSKVLRDDAMHESRRLSYKL